MESLNQCYFFAWRPTIEKCDKLSNSYLKIWFQGDLRRLSHVYCYFSFPYNSVFSIMLLFQSTIQQYVFKSIEMKSNTCKMS